MANQYTSAPWPDRFWAKVDKRGPDDCWEWTGSRHKQGYGMLGSRETTNVKAHRVSWELAHGPIPAGMAVLHRCDNPPCVNPAHLFLGTQGDNVRDMLAKGRAVSPNALKTHCKYGHEFTRENTYMQAMARGNPKRCCRACNRRKAALLRARRSA